MLLLRYLITTIACCLFFNSFGQSILTGKVSDKMGSIPGVNVFITNENDRVFLGVITDMKGEYYLRMPVGENLKLNFSFIGYRTHVVEYTGQKVENVKLREDNIELGQVIVVGQAADRSDMGILYNDQGSATERITLKDMEDQGASSVEEMLQGRMANVDLVSSSGDPGTGMSIRIRGTSSLSASAEPLIVVDGISQDLDIADDFDFADADEEDFGALVSISPSDIQSIEVLKDAAATALWGSRGGNGVLIITTKRGVVGKTRFNIGQKVNINFEPEPLELLDGFQYVSMIQEAMWNSAVDDHIGKQIPAMTAYELVFSPTHPLNDEYNQNTKWLEEITRISVSSETNFSMTGGGDRATYRFSLGYTSDIGTTVGSSYKRLNARLNINYKFSNKLRIAAGISYSDGNKDEPFKNSRQHAINKMPNMSPYMMSEDGTQRTDVYFTPENVHGSKWPKVFNPVAMSNESFKQTLSRNTSLNFTLNYNIIKGLRYSGTLGFNITNNAVDSYLPQIVTGVSRLNDNYNKSLSSTKAGLSLNINNKLMFEKQLNNAHKLLFTAALQINDKESSNSRLESGGGSSPDLFLPASGVPFKVGAGNSGARTVAVIGVFHYNLLNRYMITANYRTEGNSRMSELYRWKGFPSVALIWRVSNEPFLQDQKDWLSDVSIRASYGLSGNAPTGNHSYVGKFNVLDGYGDLSAAGPSSMQLTNLAWEKVTQKNIGIKIELWKRKVSIDADYYSKLTSDLLQKNVTIPSLTGYDKVAFYNDGAMRNRGWEFRIGVNNIIKTGDFSMSADLNISANENTIMEFPDNIKFETYPESLENGRYATTITEGHPLGSFYGFNFLGVYSDTDATYIRDNAGKLVTDITGNPVVMRHDDYVVAAGDAIYKDINEDGTINRNDIVYLGNGMPDMTGGFGIRFRYRGWSLNTHFAARINFDIINKARMNSENMDNYDNQNVAVLNRWRREGDVTDVPRALFASKSSPTKNWLGSDRFVEDGTFLRMQQLSLKYTLPKDIMQKWGISNASCFISANNLFTWTNYSGQDPEISIKGGFNGGMGVDNALTPKPKRMTFGLSFNF